VLAITGGEALYADMGHFGRRPIKWAWLVFVFPALYINYLGQGALILDDSAAVQNPFFRLVPEELLYPMVALAAAATVIASQAVISGAFSLTSQAIQLGYCPRIQIKFTSEREKGQIYVPNVNWLLLLAVVILVLGFRTSSNLASAYGIAVTLTMMIDTILAFVVVRALWGWSTLWAALFLAFFVAVDFAFFSANAVKIMDGGWFPLVLGLAVFTFLSTWKRGRLQLYQKLRQDSIPLDAFLSSVSMSGGPHRVEGTSIFMTPNVDGVPRALLHNLYHNKVLHERVVLMNVRFEDVPHIVESEQVSVETLQAGFYLVRVRYGFKDDPNIPEVMEMCALHGLEFNMMETSFFLGRETIIPTPRVDRMPHWRQVLFTWMFRNAETATAFFKIPTNRVVELGTQVEL
jgi:KUP system potassium uptake protein